MTTQINFQSRQLKLSAVALAVAAMAAGFLGCGGSGGTTPPTPTPTPTPVIIPISNAGNSPFIGVQMTAHCSNDVSASSIIGEKVPGEGAITLPSTCVPPIVVSATGAGKMRPLGAKADTTEDIPYDPSVNLPISSIFDALPASGNSITANPVTTLVYNLFSQSGLTLADAKTKVEIALGMNSGDADKDYRDPDVAKACARLAAVEALAVQKLAESSSPVTSPGQQVTDALVSAVRNAGQLKSASDMAQAIKGKVDVTTDIAVATDGEIDKDAVSVYNMMAKVQNLDGHATNVNVPATLAEISNQLSSDPDAALHRAESNKIKAITALWLTDKTNRQTAIDGLKLAQTAVDKLLDPINPPSLPDCGPLDPPPTPGVAPTCKAINPPPLPDCGPLDPPPTPGAAPTCKE